MSICITCNRVYVYDRTKGHTKTKCNSCVVNLRRFAIKQKAVDLLGGKCSRCGYNKCLSALHFHHLSNKSFGIAGSHARAWGKIEEELRKCVLLCANCHAEEHGPVA